MDSSGKPGINPVPCVMLRASENTCPLLVMFIVYVLVTPFLLMVTVYVPGGSVKVTTPCAFVTP